MGGERDLRIHQWTRREEGWEDVHTCSGGSRILEGQGEGASVRLPCSPAHLNDLVSGHLFTEPGLH